MSRAESKKSSLKRKSRSSPTASAAEPWWGRTQKITAAILGLFALMGVVWSSVSKADARYAKEVAVAREMSVVKNDLAMLGKAFQLDQYDRSVSAKQEMIWKIEDRLRQNISRAERIRLEDIKRQLQNEIDALKMKQKKLDIN